MLRRECGEDMGPPPSATPSQKRRNDNVQVPVSRPSSTTSLEVIEVDKSPPSRLAIAPNASPSVKPHARTKSQQPGSFSAGLMQYQSNPSSISVQQQIVEQQQPSQQQQRYQRTKTSQQQVRPRLGYFPEGRNDNPANVKPHVQTVKSRQPSHSRTTSQPTQYHGQEASQQALQQEVGHIQNPQLLLQQPQQVQQSVPPRDDYQRHVILQQERAKKQEARYHQQPPLQQYQQTAHQHQRSNSQSIPLVQQHEQMHSGVHSHRSSFSSPKLAVHRPSIATPPPPSAMPTSEVATDHHSRAAALHQSTTAAGRQSQSTLLQLIEPTPSSVHSASSYQLSSRPPQRVPSPALEPRLQAQMQGRAHTGPPPATLPIQKPPEPRRTSNLASILNSEPEEPRPRRKQIEPTVAQPVGPSSAVHGVSRRRGAVAELSRPQDTYAYEQTHSHDQSFSQGHHEQGYAMVHPSVSRPRADPVNREAYSQPASTVLAEWSQQAGYQRPSTKVPITSVSLPSAYGEMKAQSYQSIHSQPILPDQALSSSQVAPSIHGRSDQQPLPPGPVAYGSSSMPVPPSSYSQHAQLQAQHQQQVQSQPQVPSRMGPSPESFARSRTPSYTHQVPLAVNKASGQPAQVQAQILQPAPYSSQSGPPPTVPAPGPHGHAHATSTGYDYRYAERERPQDRERTRSDGRDYERERERMDMDRQQSQYREREWDREREHEHYQQQHAIHPNYQRLRPSDAQQYQQFSGQHQHHHQHHHQPPTAQAQQPRYPPEPSYPTHNHPHHHQAAHRPSGPTGLPTSKSHASLAPQPLAHPYAAQPHPSQQQGVQQQQQHEQQAKQAQQPQQAYAQPYLGYMSGEGRRSGR